MAADPRGLCLWWRDLVRVLLAGMLLGLATGGAAGAATLSFSIDAFTGDSSEVSITLDDAAAGSGAILMTVEVTAGVADIRGILFDIADDSLLGGLMITGADVTDVQLGNVIDLGNGANLNGGGSPCPCDVGVEIGLPGLKGGRDDFQTTAIVIMHETLDLDLSLFTDQAIGVRLTSVGPNAASREGSSKLGGVVPEPGTAALTGMGLALLALQGRRRRSR